MKRVTWFKNHKDHQDHGNLRVHHPNDNTPKTIRRYDSSVSLHVMYWFWILQYSFSNRLLWPASSCKTVRFVTYLAPLRGESFSTYYEVLPNFAIPIKRLGEVVLKGFLESRPFKSGHLSVYMIYVDFYVCWLCSHLFDQPVYIITFLFINVLETCTLTTCNITNQKKWQPGGERKSLHLDKWNIHLSIPQLFNDLLGLDLLIYGWST